MTDQLSLYNGALRVIGERRLASLSENREPRRLLDGVWDDGARRYCLEQGQWNFAARTIEIGYEPSVTPDFGYSRAFTKPDDWVRTMALASDEYFRNPIIGYEDNNGYWWSDYDTLYVKYVSDDSAYGLDLSLWPESFTKYVEHYLADEIVWPLTQNQQKKDKVEKDMERALKKARSLDAMNQPTQLPPMGSFASARLGGSWRRNG